jgi:LETM1-like protein
MDKKWDEIPMKFIKDTLKKGTDFAQDVWDATKREGVETKLAILIVRKMLQDKEVTDGEIKFLKEHSIDLVKILPLVLISGIPVPVPITPLLIILGKKYGFDLLPKDNRHHLEDTNIKGKEKEL